MIFKIETYKYESKFSRLCSSNDLDDEASEPDDESAALVAGAKDKIPYDLSISSENEVTNDELKSGDEHNSEGSLHDSMEILEEVATEDHFDNDLPIDDEDVSEESDVDDEGQEPKDIFEMPPMPDNLSQDPAAGSGSTPTPPPGGQEFIF